MSQRQRMRDELRRAFVFYAMVPMLLLLALSAGLLYIYWAENISRRNEAALEQVSATLQQTIQSGLDASERLSLQCDFDRLQQEESYKVAFYRQLYGFLNDAPAYRMFVVLDSEQNIVMSSRSQDPEFLYLSKDVFWGIVQRLWVEPYHAMHEFISYDKKFGQPMDIAVGKAITEDEKIRGYVIFVVSGSALLQEMVNPRANIVVEDAFGHTPLCTDYNFSLRVNNKLRPEFHQADGYVHYGAGDYYVGKASVLDGGATVYAISALGELRSYLQQAALVLLGGGALLLFLILRISRRQARWQTRIIERIVDAFTAAKQGDLEYRLHIPESSELRVVGDSYNRMAQSLQALMHSNEEKTRAAVLLELRQLTSQFDPHFLYNTLGSIKFMITLDPQAASEMTMALSRLLRYSIRHASAQVPLQDDMQYLYDYLAIMQYRFGERFDYAIQLEPAAQTALVPKLCLQPVIENALKYGYEGREHLLVEVHITVAAGALSIVIHDDGCGMDAAQLAEIQRSLAQEEMPAAHSGLYNIHRRLQLLYGESAGLSIQSTPGGGTTVEMHLPWRQAEEGKTDASDHC